MSGEGFAFGLLAALGMFLIFFFIIAVAFYVLFALGLFNIAKREGFEDKAWMAWVPIVQFFLLTLLVEKDVHEEIRGKVTLILGVAMIASILLTSVIPIANMLPLAVTVYAFYFLARRYSDNEVAHVVIAAISFGASLPIQLFMFRNRDQINEDDLIETKG